MSFSREEVEKIVTDFDRITTRNDKKAGAVSMKMMIIITSIVVAAIVIGIYLYMFKAKKDKGKKGDKSEKKASDGGLVLPSPEVVSGSAPVTVTI